jgi:hypothetical protein
MICQGCGTGVEPDEYHPHAFCVLYNQGIDPYEFVREAVSHVLTRVELRELASPGYHDVEQFYQDE